MIRITESEASGEKVMGRLFGVVIPQTLVSEVARGHFDRYAKQFGVPCALVGCLDEDLRRIIRHAYSVFEKCLETHPSRPSGGKLQEQIKQIREDLRRAEGISDKFADLLLAAINGTSP